MLEEKCNELYLLGSAYTFDVSQNVPTYSPTSASPTVAPTHFRGNKNDKWWRQQEMGFLQVDHYKSGSKSISRSESSHDSSGYRTLFLNSNGIE